MNTTTSLVSTLDPVRFEKQVNRLNRKARRLGVPEITYTVDGTEDRTMSIVTDEKFDGEMRTSERKIPVKVTCYTVSHLDVKQGGWVALGRLSSNDGEKFFERFNSEVDPSKWEQRDPCECDHCHSNRNRNFGWAVRNVEDGREMLVGSSCLKDLTEGDTAATLEFASVIYNFVNLDWEEGYVGGGRSSQAFFDVETCLAYVESWVSTDGWVDNQRNQWGELVVVGTHRSCAEILRGKFRSGLDESDFFDGISEGFRQKARDLIENINSLPDDDGFISDLKYCLSHDAVPANRVGLICYAHRAWQRHLERESLNAMKGKAKHVGEVKERLRGLELTCLRSHTFEGNYGATHVNSFKGKDGNLYVWKTGGYCFEKGDEVVLDGTIKEHSEYQGAKQNVITRCKVMNEAR